MSKIPKIKRDNVARTTCAMATVIHGEMTEFYEEYDIRVPTYIFISRAVHRYIKDLKEARGGEQ